MPKLPPALRPEAAASADPAARLARAEAFFATLPEDDPAFRLPFADPEGAAGALSDLAALFAALRLETGQAVLDLGCGTGWLTRILARLGLRVFACDAAPSALAKAEAAIKRDEPALLPRITFLRSQDGVAIPLSDAAVERAVLQAGPHPLPDAAGTLKEMARILAPGGRAVLVEPAPPGAEDGTPAAAMPALRLEDIALDAQAGGFAGLEVALGTAGPAFVPLAAFQRQEARLAAGRAAGAEDLRPLAARYDAFLGRARHVVLTKPGESADTRVALGYRKRFGAPGRIEILSVARRSRRVHFEIAIVNVSTLRWLPSGKAPGAVNIGVRLARRGSEEQAEYRRIHFTTEPTPPGLRREYRFSLPQPAAGLHYTLDLVAEGVCWFAAPVAGAEKLLQALPAR